MTRFLTAFTSICLACLSAGAQTPEQPLAVVTDALCYSNPSFGGVSLLEFPLMINRSQLRFYRPDTTDPNYYGRIYAQVVVYGASGQPVDSNSTYFSARVASLEEARTKNQMLFNKLAVMVPPGDYSARVMVIDAVSKRSFETLIQSIAVNPAESAKVSIGGPTLAFRISRADSSASASDRMVRNGLYVLNSPAGLFAETDTIAYLYAEIYGLKTTDGGDNVFSSSVTVSDSAGSFNRDLGWKSSPKPGGSAAVTQALDIRGWPVGLYHVSLAAVDMAAGDTARATTMLRILGTAPVVVSADSLAGETAYSDLTMGEKVSLVTYLLTPPEKATLDKLNDQGKETFLDQYWKEHDASPGTAQIENRDEMIRRLRYVNKHFSRFLTENTGWMTDMGRVYMKYGPWDQRQDVPTPRVGDPFTIWYYYGVKQGETFVFVDPLGNHDYKLVHSNAKGEKYDEAWAAKLREEMLEIR